MKKLVFAFVAMLLPLMASAEAVEINGIYYNLINKTKTAEVTSNPNGYSGSVVIPEKVKHEGTEYSVTSIDEQAFCYCRGLTSITMPNSVTSIGEKAFYGCSGLKSVKISDIEAWCRIVFSGSDSNPLCYAHHLFLNEEEIEDLVIPNSVTSIGEKAFYGCSGLTSITIPGSVTSIGYRAFYGCSSLTSVSISDGVTSIGEGSFAECSGLTSITIPSSVTSIGRETFYNCSGLTSVTIPNSVTSISGFNFYGCTGLTSVTIPGSVTSIGDGTFHGCSGLTSVTIPSSVTSIDGEAFYGCSGLTSITIGSGTKQIWFRAFASCPELTDVYCYAESVPNTLSDVFQDSYIEYCTLHVPTASVNDYKATEPWSGFKSIVALDGGETPETPKCATPTISYANGELEFSCETEGVEYVSEVTVDDAKKNYSNKVNLTGIYKVSVYATKAGYENSDVATKEIQISSGSGSGKVGDLNNDGKTDAADIVTIVNIIMDK